MPWFSSKSLEKLGSCDIDLQMIFRFVIRYFDCTILEGRRGQNRQDMLKISGATTLNFPDSKHNKLPSLAVDVAPYPVDWPQKLSDVEIDKLDVEKLRRLVKGYARWYRFIGQVEGIAAVLGIRIRVGADWDGDMQLTDQTFDDLPHYEKRLPSED